MDVFGIPVFEGVPFPHLVLLVALYLFAFTIKGIFGHGAVPPMVQALAEVP